MSRFTYEYTSKANKSYAGPDSEQLFYCRLWSAPKLTFVDRSPLKVLIHTLSFMPQSVNNNDIVRNRTPEETRGVGTQGGGASAARGRAPGRLRGPPQ